jgi:hypothetical protein
VKTLLENGANVHAQAGYAIERATHHEPGKWWKVSARGGLYTDPPLTPESDKTIKLLREAMQLPRANLG